MCVDICRRFVLHNDFIPPTDKAHSWDYLSFGYYDGISVGENIFHGNGCNLVDLWEDNINTVERLDELESMQLIYGFRTENEGDSNTDRHFWKDMGEDTAYPFVFFSMLQFEEDGRNHLKELFQRKQQVETRFASESECKAILYLTLENSDLILVLRCRDYNKGAKIIDDIHRSEVFYQLEDKVWKIRYSFTVPAVDKRFLNRKEEYPSWGSRVNCAYIYVTERYSGSIDLFCQALESRLGKGHIDKKQSVLGYNDELIALRDLHWDVFLALYRDVSGLLNHSSHEYQTYVTSITTIIGLIQEETSVLPDASAFLYYRNMDYAPIEDRGERYSFCSFLKEKLKKISESISKYPVLHKNMVQSLHNLVHSLSKFESSHISENLFFPSACSIHMLIMVLHELFTENNALDEILCYQDYQRFLNALNLYAQNSARSDRQFTQAMDFNVRIYNLPVKLNAFYNAFIYYVKEFLNAPPALSPRSNGSHSYEFLTCPGVSSNMHVEELFMEQSADKRLFLVNIPENQAYDLNLMMIMLSHEIAHFVGSSIRNREVRNQRLREALCRMVVLYYRYNMRDVLDMEKYEKYWSELEQVMDESVKEYQDNLYIIDCFKKKYIKPEHETEEDYQSKIKSIMEFRRGLRYHSQIVEEDLADAMASVIRSKQNFFFQPILYQTYMERYKASGGEDKSDHVREQQRDSLYRCSMELMQVRRDLKDIINFETMIDLLMDLCKECLSDIIGVMMLELTPGQYFDALLQSAKDQGRADALVNMNVNEILIRASLVTSCMIQTKDGRELGYGWGGDMSVQDSRNPHSTDFSQKINVFICQYIKDDNPKIWERNDMNDRICNYLCDKKLLQSIRQYLMQCRETFAAKVGDKKEMQKGIISIFSITKSETLDSMMLQLQLIIDDYRKRINGRMQDAVH